MNDETRDEENLIKNAETEEIEKLAEIESVESDVLQDKHSQNKKMDKYVEFVLLFILGILVGVAIKTEAVKRIAIGFDDYQMKSANQDFDINNLQVEVIKKSVQDAKSEEDKNQEQNDIIPTNGSEN
jgi:hypothetical protein